MLEIVSISNTDIVSARSMWGVEEDLLDTYTLETDSVLTDAAEKAGIIAEVENILAEMYDVEEEPEDLYEEIIADYIASKEEEFDPSQAGTVSQPDEGALQDSTAEGFDPSEAGTTEPAADPEQAVQVPETEEGFDPSQAGTIAGEGSGEVQAEEASKDLQITAEYRYSDPEGLEYDKRYVFYGNAESALAVQLSSDRNAAVSDVYVIFYVKDGRVAAEYRCFVADGIAVCEETAPEGLEALISSLPVMEEKAYEASPDGYQNFIKDVYGLKNTEEEN